MFPSLPTFFRKYDLNADVRTLLLLRKSVERGLVHTLGDLYLVLKGLVTNDPKDYGPFTTAFYEYFLDVEIKKGERLENAIARSEAFKEWRKDYLEDGEIPNSEKIQELVDKFLDEVHLTTYDIQKVLSGAEILKNDDPNRVDDGGQAPGSGDGRVDKMADYSDISLEELRKRMEQVAAQQNENHEGGDHWIGQGGMSPFGQNGAANGGIRVGGGGGGKMARAVVGNPNFYPVDTKATLSDDNIDIALASLKGIEDETTEMLLDIPQTIVEGVKMGGLFLPHIKEKTDQKVQVILMIDNGGYSMTPYIKAVQKLFSKMKLRFAHDLKVYYYHNTIYGGAWTDVRRTQFVSIDKIASLDKNYSFFVIGDADMAPYELSESSKRDWGKLKKHFARMVWLNPLALRIWAMSETVNSLKRMIPMYPLTPEGIEKSVELMNKKRKYYKVR